MGNEIRCSLWNKVFDPSSEFILHWNKFMLVARLLNFFLDPLFLFIPAVSDVKAVIILDLHVAATLVTLRTALDLFQLFGIFVKFRTAYEDPPSKIFRERKLIEDPNKIAIKYLRSTFILDLLVVLPLPQAFIWHQVLASRMNLELRKADLTMPLLFGILWTQTILRFFVFINTKADITKRFGILMNGAMSGAFYNLLCFVNISNLIGAIFYIFHIDWLSDCMDIMHEKELDLGSLHWDQLLSNCTQNYMMDQGMFSSALTNKIGTRNFVQKFMFCFSWGLKSLSSLGQSFSTSFSTLESTFSIFVTLYGLILLADLITRMQAGIQSMEDREEQQRSRQREIKEWMDYHQLSVELKERVNLAIRAEWTGNCSDDETMLDSLPVDLRSEIRKYLYMDSVCKLPKFASMDAPLVQAICQHLKTFSGREGAYIVYEGDFVKQMLFIYSGQLELSFTDRGNSSVTILEHGDCCGQELVTWASQPSTSMDSLPTSSWTIKCLTDVEAFVLQAYDMKILATQFAHNQDFQRAFKQHYP